MDKHLTKCCERWNELIHIREPTAARQRLCRSGPLRLPSFAKTLNPESIFESDPTEGGVECFWKKAFYSTQTPEAIPGPWREKYQELKENVTDPHFWDEYRKDPRWQFFTLKLLQEETEINETLTAISWRITQDLLNPKARKMLCLDGGGIRGYFVAKSLQSLIAKWSVEFPSLCKEQERSSNNWGRFHPASRQERAFLAQFDTFAGTSIGAILLVMTLVGLSLDGCMDIFTNYTYYFAQSWSSWITRGLPIFGAKYDPSRIHAKIDDVIDSAAHYHQVELNTLGDLYQFMKQRPVYITSFDCTMNKAHVFNSGDPAQKDYLLKEVLRATMAAPTYFPPQTVTCPHEPKIRQFIDGGVFANDPSLAAFYVAYIAAGRQTYSILNIGTMEYTSPVRNQGGYVGWLMQGDHNIVDIVMQASSSFAETALDMMGHHFHDLRRYKFNFTMTKPMALDDPSFIPKLNETFNSIENSSDMAGMLEFVKRYITDVSPDDSHASFSNDIIRPNIRFNKIVESHIERHVPAFPSFIYEMMEPPSDEDANPIIKPSKSEK
eukprot:TRINITY_DN5695_c0_g1_i1.p1 TRINITY_DN5695_c0_g1~~TRINITY_DN5695_c0_g1_i1.p1  ORF type:complete len:605 (-),score=133.16 TRINITY_DN5695_c0_g1_i1:29-1678(-)